MASAPAPKELRNGRYVLLSPLGQGSQGTTWDAVDKREGRAVAVKAFDVRGARSWKDVELAEREARVLSELHHRLLPRYIEHFEEGGTLYLAMEKVAGTPVSQLHKGPTRMTEKDVARLLHDADEALAYLHGRSPPVIHRDLKPSNIIRRPDGSFAFVDFGAVRDRLRPEGGSTVVGTFGYMAPEQFQGRATPASDVYSVGATALELLTGKEPEELPHKGLTLDVRAALGTSVSPRLEEALIRMLEPDPDRRATSIAPLLSAPSREPRSQRAPPDAWRDAVSAAVASSRHARRAARREAKRARRWARREERRLRGDSVPVGVHVLFGLGLTVAHVVVSLALNVVVPLLLTLLSLLFGRGLRRAAHAVRLAGDRAVAAIDESRADLGRGWAPPPARTGVRVDPDGGRRVRVSTGNEGAARGGIDDEDELDGEDDDEAEAEKRRRAR